MPVVLLRPYVLSYKNRLLGKSIHKRTVTRELMVLGFIALTVNAVFLTVYTFLMKIQLSDEMSAVLPGKVLSLSLFCFFILLIISNLIASLGYFYGSRDLQLLLPLPISTPRLYATRICKTLLNSSWMFLLFLIPASAAYTYALELSPSFMVVTLFIAIPLMIIPAAFAGVISTIFVNIVPANYFKETLLLIAVAAMFAYTVYAPHNSLNIPAPGSSASADAILLLEQLDDPHPKWLPSNWASQLLSASISGKKDNAYLYFALLLSTTLGFLGVGYLVFDLLFSRGWGRATHTRKNLRVQGSNFGSKIGRLLIPFRPQMRALFYKEARMFVRDTSQSMQLIMLLLLTFVYLYNFRALRMAGTFTDEVYTWWRTILSISNIALGSCVVAAISTRFVFPSISMEGASYVILRSTPMGIGKLVWSKFFVWLGPISLISITLIVSGAWAIQAAPDIVAISALLAVVLSIGIVGLGIGIGAVYAKFDWDTPTQISASFGSLVFMLLSMSVVMATLFPASLLFILSSIPAVSSKLDSLDYVVATCCSIFLAIFINIIAAYRAIDAGIQALEELEE